MVCARLLLCLSAGCLAAGFYPEPAEYFYPEQLLDYKTNDKFLKTENTRISIEEQVEWPPENIFKDIRQVAGVDVDRLGNVHVFHRGDRMWDMRSFKGDNYQQQELGPIQIDTILILDPSSGQVIRSWGKNRFYLPHGLTLDSHENSWVTDVALHQVFKFASNNEEPLLVLGEKFKPGSDRSHFCKPTDVAVSSSGIVFVSDGYCNSRIIAFKPDGTFHGEFGQQDKMNVPHSLSLIEERKCLCVADRENARILCYSLKEDGSLGDLTVNNDVPTGAPYAIVNRGEYMLAVTLSYARDGAAMGITMKLSDGDVINTWHSYEGFSMPHDMAISSNGTFLYVVDVGKFTSKKVFKFEINDVI
ncbi:peptidyl-glycine alpha-amidating monooxygenase A-like [Centruroides vittatus]|uniref:peptidyl-glycine alpha-amidating monooxygenase A-like n=1 Tax=Centruroides vittatus TaxID=120091 RepID=UPI00350F7B7C